MNHCTRRVKVSTDICEIRAVSEFTLKSIRGKVQHCEFVSKKVRTVLKIKAEEPVAWQRPTPWAQNRLSTKKNKSPQIMPTAGTIHIFPYYTKNSFNPIKEHFPK